jgi:hypothetical protein
MYVSEMSSDNMKRLRSSSNGRNEHFISTNSGYPLTSWYRKIPYRGILIMHENSVIWKNEFWKHSGKERSLVVIFLGFAYICATSH